MRAEGSLYRHIVRRMVSHKPRNRCGTLLPNTTEPSYAAPYNWNSFFAILTPMMLTFLNGPPFSMCFDTTSMVHRNAVGG